MHFINNPQHWLFHFSISKEMSAGDEDTELRDLVTQTLENNGLLGKIQAQLRAGVFLALEETDKKVRYFGKMTWHSWPHVLDID